jgi:hypothetical protein
MSVGDIAGTAVCFTAMGAASLGPSQAIGAGIVVYSLGEAAFLLTRVTYAALRNLGKHGINDRREYKNYDAKNLHYTLADKSYFKIERIKAEGLWLKTVTVQRAVLGFLAMLPFVGIIWVVASGMAEEENRNHFWSRTNIGTIDRILKDIETPNPA